MFGDWMKRAAPSVLALLLLLALSAAAALARRSAHAGGLDAAAVRACLVGDGATPYAFVMGRDGLLYLMNGDEPDPAGWLEVLVSLRASLLPALARVPIARDGTVRSPRDGRLTETEAARVERCLRGSNGYSGVHSVSFRDSGTPALTTCGGAVCFLSSRDYHSRGWRQENVLYVLHELAHVAMGAPAQERAHTLEFYRVYRVLSRAAEAMGKRVYDPAWYAWGVGENKHVIGAWAGTAEWYDVAESTLGGGHRWKDRTLERGPDWFVKGTGSLVTAAPLSAS